MATPLLRGLGRSLYFSFLLTPATVRRASLGPKTWSQFHSPGPPSLYKLLFSTVLNFSHPSARLFRSDQPIDGSHPRRGSAPCPSGANPRPASRVPGLVPKRLACDGSAPGAARREGAGLWVRDGRGRGEGKREVEEVAAGLKATVSWQLGQALVSAVQLRSGPGRSCDGSTRAFARRRRIFSRSGSSPFTSPPPRSCLSRRSGAAPGGPQPAVTPPETPLEPPENNSLLLSSA